MLTQCIHCKVSPVEEVVKENKRYFFCAACQRLSPRSLDSRYGRDVTISSPSGKTHVSVGAMIYKGPSLLLLRRRGYPFGYDIPAGHVEYGESPEEALKREVWEELGLKVVSLNLAFKGEIKGNKCRYGADNHIWHVYACQCETYNPFLNPESESIGWYSPEEIFSLDLVDSADILLTHILK